MMLNTFRMIRFVVFVALCSAAQRAFPFESTKNLPDPDCGAKCLYVILLEQGAAPVSYRDFVRELGPASKQGYSLLQLQNAARSRGLFAESCRLEAEDLKLIGKDPAVILHMNPGHFVICSNFSMDQLIIYDAASGMMSTESSQFLENWSGNSLLVSRKELQLPVRPPALMLGWWWIVSGIALVCCVIFSLSRYLFRGSALFLIAIIPCIEGCEKHSPNRSESTTKTIENLGKIGSSKVPLVRIEKSNYDAGNLNMSPSPQTIAVAIQNRENEPIEISEVRISCSCLSGRILSKTIQPSATETLELLLDRSNTGPKNAMCTVMCNGHPVASLRVSWTVTAELTLIPDSITDLELEPGETKEVVIEIDVHNKLNPPKLLVERVWNLNQETQSRGIEATARISENKCIVTFSAQANAQRKTVSGGLLIRFDDRPEPAAIVPFIVSIRTEINVSPAQLFLTPGGEETLSAQLLIQTDELANLAPFELHWIHGDNRSQCNFTFEDQDGIKIVDLQANPNEIDGVTELEITAGTGFVKRIPAFFPKNK